MNVNVNMSNANKWDDAAAAFATFVAFCDIGVHTLNILITNALFLSLLLRSHRFVTALPCYGLQPAHRMNGSTIRNLQCSYM